MKPEAVIFDCDGVLVDSEPMSAALVSENLSRHGLDMSAGRIDTLFVGGTMAGLADEARALGADLPPDWVEQMYVEIFARLAAGTPLMPGVPALLDALDGAGVPYAVGSNGPHRKMEITLGQHPEVYARLKGRIFSRHDVARPKPAPDLYLHVAAALGVAPERCVVVEDSATGARAAVAAGMRCMGYAPLGKDAALVAVGAEPFRDMADLPGLIGL